MLLETYNDTSGFVHNNDRKLEINNLGFRDSKRTTIYIINAINNTLTIRLNGLSSNCDE